MKSQLNLGTEAYQQVDEINAVNQKLVQELNNGIHSQTEVREIISQITDEKIDSSTEIRLPFHTDFGRNLHIGKNVFINSNVMFTDLGGIYLGDNVLIGPNVTIASVNHRIEPSQRRHLNLQSVCIHDNAWIAANVTITPGVVVGENAIVAAGAVVTHNVPDNTIVAGVPARVIKTIKNEDK
ncbi:DapH/DapD/GlmU-related protein [Companilactobacillus kimchiensis]|uniref:Galactoside O-acetyltransferase n=1 Tax=Companilactobacillus kimchiensis TaxID=993692 RepID=A0A0R2LAD2_9LACO|nr:DapH/DapD/GlmU-related protein [Companilactobacillus kimchiensis]KRN98847.1 galactoside O-acetyltransferase [Companilactobacillus kimchiensis]